MASFSRDSASVNGVAVRRLRTTFNKSSDILCICHTLCHLGEHFDLDILGVFLSAFIKLVYSSARAKTIWAALIGEAVEGFSEIRWWCKAMIMMQIARAFPKLKLFLDKLVQENVGDATTKTMLEIYTNNTVKLKVQLAAMLDMRKVTLCRARSCCAQTSASTSWAECAHPPEAAVCTNVLPKGF